MNLQPEKFWTIIKNIWLNLLYYFLPNSWTKLKPGQQIPSPSELMGKILIKNKKGSHEKPAQTKKPSPAVTDQTAAAEPAQEPNASSQDGSDPAAPTQENQGALQISSEQH